MKLTVHLQPLSGTAPDVEYRWDSDTDILSARLRASAVREGASSSVELEGKDGSWLVLDLSAGRVAGVEIAVWPDVRQRSSLSPPAHTAEAEILIPASLRTSRPAALEVQTRVVAEADDARKTIHFRLGAVRSARTVRVARDLLAEVDAEDRLAGLWLLNVPPCPPA